MTAERSEDGAERENDAEREDSAECEGDGGGSDDLDAAIDARLRSIDAERYRRNSEHVLRDLRKWLREERGVRRLADVAPTDCRRWVQGYLRARVRDGNESFGAASAETYYAIARAFFAWCVRDRRLEENPMTGSRVSEELPERVGDPDRQFWTESARRKLLDHADAVAREAADAGEGAARAFRDRAIVYLLADTAARGAELFAVSGDDRRTGLRWRDADLEAGTMTVLGKSRGRQSVQLPATTAEKLARYRRVLDPDPDWPVVPTMDAASKYRRVREALADRGWDRGEIEATLEEANDVEEVLRARDVAPPALTTEGARRRMQALSEAAGAEVDGEYLKPHGGRRALGHRLYWEVSAEAAQSVLRHESVQTTHEAYQDARAGQLSRTVDDLLYGDDGG